MKTKLLILISFTAVFLTAGCVKETYNLDKLSKKGHLSPTLAISAVRGDMSLDDLIDQNDTVVFGTDNSVRLVFKEDSVINFKMSDYYDLNDMVSFNQSYTIGEIALGPFSGTVYPLTTTGELPFPAFTNFENATLSQGALDITIRNNTSTLINTVTVTIYNISPHQPLGAPATITSISPGQTKTSSINLSDLTIIRNNTSAGFVINAPGITLNGSNLQITMAGRDMKVKSGKIVIPPQNLSSLDGKDTVEFDPGTDVEIDVIKMLTGNISYTVNCAAPVSSSMILTLPTALRNSIPISETLNANPNSVTTGSISVNNSTISLGTITSHPFNMLPVTYTLQVSSSGNIVNFNSTDKISLDLSMLNPDFDYVKGYFGQKTETLDKDTLDLDIKDILDHLSGEFLISSPSIKLNYWNSFSLPIKVDLQATGYRQTNKVDLGLSPVTLSYPAGPAERDKQAIFTIDKANSSLPALISMPPEKICFSGSALMNPLGNTGRNNYLYSNSRFLGSLEIEVPLEFRMNSLQLCDTVDNFIKIDSTDSPVKPENFEFLRVKINAENGFPLGVSVSMTLYDSNGAAGHKNLSTVDASGLLEAAPVDATGKVSAPVNCETTIDMNKDFWSSVDSADKIILKFTLNTSDNGTRDVKIYSDYRINFKASLVLKPDIRFDM